MQPWVADNVVQVSRFWLTSYMTQKQSLALKILDRDKWQVSDEETLMDEST